MYLNTLECTQNHKFQQKCNHFKWKIKLGGVAYYLANWITSLLMGVWRGLGVKIDSSMAKEWRKWRSADICTKTVMYELSTWELDFQGGFFSKKEFCVPRKNRILFFPKCVCLETFFSLLKFKNIFGRFFHPLCKSK